MCLCFLPERLHATLHVHILFLLDIAQLRLYLHTLHVGYGLLWLTPPTDLGHLHDCVPRLVCDSGCIHAALAIVNAHASFSAFFGQVLQLPLHEDLLLLWVMYL